LTWISCRHKFAALQRFDAPCGFACRTILIFRAEADNLGNVPQREIRLIRKYAAALNGFDLTDAAVGDVLLVADDIAAMLIREGWAEPTVTDRRTPPVPSAPNTKR
jgi:hypothetical protein